MAIPICMFAKVHIFANCYNTSLFYIPVTSFYTLLALSDVIIKIKPTGINLHIHDEGQQVELSLRHVCMRHCVNVIYLFISAHIRSGNGNVR